MTAFFEAIRHPGSVYRGVLWALSYERLLKDVRTKPGAAGRLFDEKGVAFVHIPKAAGTSVSSALYGRVLGHFTWADLYHSHPEGFARWLVFAIVRDPVDRFLSAYDYLVQGAPAETNRAFRRRFMQGRPSASAFIDARLRPPRSRTRILAWAHFRPQSEFVVDAAGTVRVRRLIPFDRLGEMLPDLLPPGAGLPRVNVTQGARTTRASLSADDVDLLLEIYQDDVALFQFAHAAAGTDVYGRSPQECAAVRTAR